MRKLIFILFILIGLSCCNNKDETLLTCEFSDPLEDLTWLKEYKESLKDCNIQISIFQATYKNQTVFYSAITDPLVNSIFKVLIWDCEGKVIKVFDNDERENFSNSVTKRVVLYRCKR
ncbi:hypothetical protein EO244_15455 [Ancylomarina salipaludis]|uniref:Lipoprotein n=1 Tax=Ancylomarina salipaludis TaxID=2501299 RepID=A0A4Q1JIF3_9BACT|nr:hypothetical protein [Ancylomarina salipaludis]RXQ88131.1 hypothetical protein EO244_15455 [Ancylomarina salipaludis]